jgi:hypothetical protein
MKQKPSHFIRYLACPHLLALLLLLSCCIFSFCDSLFSGEFDLVEFIVKSTEKKDFVVLKIDLDGREWQILQQLEDRNVFAYIDEIFVNFLWWKDDWESFLKKKGLTVMKMMAITGPLKTDVDVKSWIKKRRDEGVYAHVWP